ncbi:MAG TPA: hypothetical protein DCE39_09585 [Planctomycetaceae bacterium]|nr:hypothetical protein [Planctomycetaceae bacterium]|tara:strand:+ start:3756 stop:4064 length:309 start_codon:yes stop_codon:yes gene_type:complete
MAKKKITKKATKKTTKSVAKKTTKKKAAKKTTRKKKSTEPIRYRLIWGVYSSGMREESRFDYGKRKDADKKAEQLTAKGKKLFWVQPIKEEIVPEPEVPEDE